MKNISTRELLATIRECTSEICDSSSDNDRISIQDIYRLAANKLRERAQFYELHGNQALANAYMTSQGSLLSVEPELLDLAEKDGRPVDSAIGAAGLKLDEVRVRRSSGGFTYFQN